MNALLASALSFAASALSASEMSCRLSFDSPGDGGCEVAGVLGWDETALDPESLDMALFVRSGLLRAAAQCRKRYGYASGLVVR